MRPLNPMASWPYFLSLIVVSLLVGLAMPAYYDWTGADQSRPSPLVPQTAVAILVLGGIFCLLLPWLPLPKDDFRESPRQGFRFKIRTILGITTAAAFCFAVFRDSPLLVANGIIYALLLCYAGRIGFLFAGYRWKIAALFACMYLPYAWILFPDQSSNSSSAFMLMAVALPAFFPSLWIATLFHQSSHSAPWLFLTVASLELVLGVWMIQLGPKRSLVYCMGALIASTFGAFTLNALVRM